MTENRKKYYPPMHTAEHILNQTMIRMFNTERSFSNHIEKKKSKCDYHFSRNLTDEEISEINKNVNEIISENIIVDEILTDRNEAIEKYKITKLPVDQEKIRIIKVGEYDYCACSGPHVKNTSEIGEFYITTSSFENNVLRIRFKLKNPSTIY